MASPGKERHQRVDDLLDLFDLREFARVRFDELSTGTKQKLSLAKSLVNDPALLLLDEPTVGLDPDVARRIREAIQRLHRDKGTTILMTTHNMKEAESLCEQIAFIKDGMIKALGKPTGSQEGVAPRGYDLHQLQRIALIPVPPGTARDLWSSDQRLLLPDPGG